MPVVLSIGLVNQLLNVATLAKLPAGNFVYLKASALADILSIFSLVPFILRHAGCSDPHSHWVMFYHAHLELFFINSLITASGLCVVGMTVDRYFSVCHPIRFFNANESRSKQIWICAGLYATAFLIYLPSVGQKTLVQEVDIHGRVIYVLKRYFENNSKWFFRIYLFIRELASRFGPVVTIVLLNALMMRTLHKRSARRWSSGSTSGPVSCTGREGDRSRISVLLLVTSATFVACNVPASLLSLFVDHVRINAAMDRGWQLCRALANLLQTTCYLYNFYLYALCSSEYRAAFSTLFGCTVSSQSNAPHSTLVGGRHVLVSTHSHNQQHPRTKLLPTQDRVSTTKHHASSTSSPRGGPLVAIDGRPRGSFEDIHQRPVSSANGSIFSRPDQHVITTACCEDQLSQMI